MKFNADLEKRTVILPEDYQWVDSPMNGVERMRLDSLDDDADIVTTIVRFAPNSSFSPHTHIGGEEFFVLEGTFADENGEYPAGSYVRNPIGTNHIPKMGEQGCTIFVKLGRFAVGDDELTRIDTHAASWHPGLVDGLSVLPLHQFGGVNSALVKWVPNTQFNLHQHWGGEEILVLEGTFYDEHGVYPKGTWLRSPHLSQHTPFTKDDGALIYVKTGHL